MDTTIKEKLALWTRSTSLPEQHLCAAHPHICPPARSPWRPPRPVKGSSPGPDIYRMSQRSQRLLTTPSQLEDFLCQICSRKGADFKVCPFDKVSSILLVRVQTCRCCVSGGESHSGQAPTQFWERKANKPGACAVGPLNTTDGATPATAEADGRDPRWVSQGLPQPCHGSSVPVPPARHSGFSAPSAAHLSGLTCVFLLSRVCGRRRPVPGPLLPARSPCPTSLCPWGSSGPCSGSPQPTSQVCF